MNDPNVKKLKTSTAPPISEQDEGVDFFTTNKNGEKKSEIGPGDSDYTPGNIKTSQWKSVSKGGAKNIAVPGLPNENILEGLAPYCSQVNSAKRGNTETYTSSFVPKTQFDYYRTQYETPDLTKQIDLKASLPSIPSFADIYGEIQDTAYIKRYYLNRLGLINELKVNSESELATQKNPYIQKSRHEFLVYLSRMETFVINQLAEVDQKEKSQPTT